MWRYGYDTDSRDHYGSVLMSVSFSVNISLPLPSSPSPFHNSTRNVFQTEGKAHCLWSIQEEKFKIKDFNLKAMKYVMKCRFIVVAIPDTDKAVLIYFFLVWQKKPVSTFHGAKHYTTASTRRKESRLKIIQSYRVSAVFVNSRKNHHLYFWDTGEAQKT